MHLPRTAKMQFNIDIAKMQFNIDIPLIQNTLEQCPWTEQYCPDSKEAEPRVESFPQGT